MSDPDTPLESIPGFPPSIRARLAAMWITTAEDLCAAAANPNGADALAVYLACSAEEAARLVAQARAEMGTYQTSAPFAPPPLGALRAQEHARGNDDSDDGHAHA